MLLDELCTDSHNLGHCKEQFDAGSFDPGGGDDDDHGHIDDGDGHVDDDDDDGVDVEDIPRQNWKCRGSANGASHACLSTLQMHFVQDHDNHDNDDGDDDDDNYHLSLAFHER